MTMSDPRLGMVAGEPSGDLLAQLLLGGLKQRWPALQSFGLGGPQMQTQGFDAWWNYDLLAVHGYSLELLLRLRRLFALRAELGDRLLKERPDAFIGVDVPDFNLGLEARLKKAGMKTIHFVSPSIWAWRGGRIHKIREAVDHVLCLFPFEPEIYQRAGIAASYVGHPLADAIPLEVPREAARAALGLPLDARVIALLPGSRRGEVRHIAPALLGAAARLAKQNPDLRFVLPAMRGVRDLLDPMVAKFAGQFDLQVLDGRSYEALAACDLTLIASGTATLEAALFKRPMVITYSMHWLSWIRMQGMAYQPWVGLPNILLRGFVVPELLQDSCTPEAVAQAAQQWLDSPSRCEGVGQRFAELHHLLRQDTARRASDAVAQVLGR